MKKLANFILLLSSFIGYLEWGNQKRYIFSLEMELLIKSQEGVSGIMHPFIIIPLAGQLLLIFTLFQKQPGKAISLLSVACIGLIMLLLLVIGTMALNLKIFLFAVPFLLAAIWVLKLNLRK